MAGRGLSPAPWLGAEDRAPHGCLGLTGRFCREPRSCRLLGASCVLGLVALVWESCAASCEQENPGTKRCGWGHPEVAGSRAPCPGPALGLPGPAGRCSLSALIHKLWGSFLVEPCSSNWKGAGNPSVWRALEPLFERSVIFQSNSLPKPPFIKYSWDPFSPGTPSPRLSPKNQSGSSALL